MQAYIHGGKCCGIKHIHELGWNPAEMLPRKKKTRPLKSEATSYMNSTRPFFCDAAPKETYEQRLDRILAFIKEKRPRGVIEIVLSDHQLIAWRFKIEERGFKRVTKAKNSNSGVNIHIYHLVTE